MSFPAGTTAVSHIFTLWANKAHNNDSVLISQAKRNTDLNSHRLEAQTVTGLITGNIVLMLFLYSHWPLFYLKADPSLRNIGHLTVQFIET